MAGGLTRTWTGVGSVAAAAAVAGFIAFAATPAKRTVAIRAVCDRGRLSPIMRRAPVTVLLPLNDTAFRAMDVMAAGRVDVDLKVQAVVETDDPDGLVCCSVFVNNVNADWKTSPNGCASHVAAFDLKGQRSAAYTLDVGRALARLVKSRWVAPQGRTTATFVPVPITRYGPDCWTGRIAVTGVAVIVENADRRKESP